VTMGAYDANSSVEGACRVMFGSFYNLSNEQTSIR